MYIPYVPFKKYLVRDVKTGGNGFEFSLSYGSRIRPDFKSCRHGVFLGERAESSAASRDDVN